MTSTRGIGNFAAFNEIYARYFGDTRPARSTVEVAGLPKAAGCELWVEHFGGYYGWPEYEAALSVGTSFGARQ